MTIIRWLKLPKILKLEVCNVKQSLFISVAWYRTNSTVTVLIERCRLKCCSEKVFFLNQSSQKCPTFCGWLIQPENFQLGAYAYKLHTYSFGRVRPVNNWHRALTIIWFGYCQNQCIYQKHVMIVARATRAFFSLCSKNLLCCNSLCIFFFFYCLLLLL